MKTSLKSRRGVSLVELLVVMSLGSVLLTTSAVVLHRVMNVHGKTRNFLSASRNGLRLSDQFRSDVHRVTKVTTSDLDAPVVLRLQLGEANVVEYSHAGGEVRRTQLEGEKTVSREEYSFPANSRVLIREESSPRLLSLSVISQPGDPAGSAQPGFATAVYLRIEAQVGRDSRYTDVKAEAHP
jgi:prepilin-type N-terminal cleavage/methylation domain-containing protein